MSRTFPSQAYTAARVAASQTSHPHSSSSARPSGGLVEGHADPHVGHTEPSGSYTRGMRIFHQKFGYGRIVSVDDNRLEIEFDKAGRKKVIDSFVAPA